MKDLSVEALNAIKLLVESISWKLADVRSEYFSHIQYSQLKTTTPCGYIRTKMLLAKLEGKINTDKWAEMDPDNYQCKAVFCHGNLTPEHIILDGIDVVGVVGWSSADFVPEVCDRLQYYFRSAPNDPMCWYRFMAETYTCAEGNSLSIDFVINAATYEFYMAQSNASKKRKAELASLWKTITMNHTVVSCIATAKETKSNTMLQSSLTSWWNQSQHILSEDD